jgi:hypothetical protein
MELMSDLENILPKGWGEAIFAEGNEEYFNDETYRYICRRFSMIPSYLQREFNIESGTTSALNGNKKAIYLTLKKINDAIEKNIVVASTFGQDYDSLIKTTNELVETVLKEGIKFDVKDIADHNTRGIHSYAPIISFLKKIYGDDLSGKDILEIGARAYGISALTHLNSLGANVHGLDSEYHPGKNLLRNNNIDYINGRWENISGIFAPESMDVIYINYMYPSPYNNGPFHKEGFGSTHTNNLEMFEHHIAEEMHKILKPNGMYIMRNWGCMNNNEYLYFNRKNFNQYDMTVYPIDSYGEGKSIHFDVGSGSIVDKSDRLKELDIEMDDVRKYPLSPSDKDMYFGTRLIVFEKKA